MNRLLILGILTICFSYQTKSQNYHPFVEENKVWGELMLSWGSTSTTFYELQGDTTINSKVYKVVYSTGDSLMQYWSRENYYFIREDTNRKVYRLDFNDEKLIYDFSLQVGDSIDTRGTMGGQPVIAGVDSIDSVFINGEYRKKIIFDSWFNEFWIEGIGSSTKPFNPFINSFVADIGWELSCVKYNDTVIYQNPNYDKCYIDEGVFINEYKTDNDKKVKINPQPANNTANIKIFDKVNSYKEIFIFNNRGQTIMKDRLINNSIILQTTELTSGLYLVLIIGDNQVLTTKLLIEK